MSSNRWVRLLVSVRYVMIRLATLLIMMAGALILVQILGANEYGTYSQVIAFAGVVGLVSTFGQAELYLRAEICFSTLIVRVCSGAMTAGVVATVAGVAILGKAYAIALAALSAASVLSIVTYCFWVRMQFEGAIGKRALSELSFRFINQLLTVSGGFLGRTSLWAAVGSLAGSIVPAIASGSRRIRAVTETSGGEERGWMGGLRYAAPLLLVNATLSTVALIVASRETEEVNAGVRFLTIAATACLTLARAIAKEQIQRESFVASDRVSRWQVVRHNATRCAVIGTLLALGVAAAAPVADLVLPSGVPPLFAALLVMSIYPLLLIANLSFDVFLQADRAHKANVAKELLVLATTVVLCISFGGSVAGIASSIVGGELVGFLFYVLIVNRRLSRA